MKSMRAGIKRANFIHIMLSKPDGSRWINGNTPGSSTGRRDRPLANGCTGRIIHTDGVCDRHGEPDFASVIDRNKGRLTVACGERNSSNPAMRSWVKQCELTRESRIGTTRCQVTAGHRYPDKSTTVKCSSPRIAPRNSIIGNATDACCGC